jgi:hypothetical protein
VSCAARARLWLRIGSTISIVDRRVCQRERVVARRMKRGPRALRRRERAVVVLQSWVRGHLARRCAARARAAAATAAKAAACARAAEGGAARAIQRAWRAHARARRYCAALAVAAAADARGCGPAAREAAEAAAGRHGLRQRAAVIIQVLCRKRTGSQRSVLHVATAPHMLR